MALNRGLLFAALLSVIFQLQACLAREYKVGETGSWNLSSNNNYQKWADSKTFYVGDTLAFSYTKSEHSVVETDSAGYQSCAPSNPSFQDDSGDTAVHLKTAGTHYFICATPGHCSAGMKFSVSVLDSSTTSTSPQSTPTTDSSAAAATVAPLINTLFSVGVMNIVLLFIFFL